MHVQAALHLVQLPGLEVQAVPQVPDQLGGVVGGAAELGELFRQGGDLPADPPGPGEGLLRR